MSAADVIVAARARSRVGTPEDAQYQPVKPRRRVRASTGLPCPSSLRRPNIVAQGIQAIRTLRSGVVPDAVLLERNRRCQACPYATHLEVDDRSWTMCGCCGCGHWRVANEDSSCESKNRHAAHECPLNLPRFNSWRGVIDQNGRVRLRDLPGMLTAAWRSRKR